MTLCSRNKIRRCRPLLGTFVEITATGADENGLQHAASLAFTAIEKIQNRMSVHDEKSELSRLNREAALHPVIVSRELFSVLRRANVLANESQGAFDYTVAPRLAEWGFLPARLSREHSGDWRDVRLLPGRQVHFLRPLALDFGGIAKGFAVDRAIRILQQRGAESAVVNAGGDLRTFGPQPSRAHLRHPAIPQKFMNEIPLFNAALATSSPCFTEKYVRGKRVSHLVNPQTQTSVVGTISVSVRARECWIADALTKVVLNAPECASKLLEKYHAEAFVLTA